MSGHRSVVGQIGRDRIECAQSASHAVDGLFDLSLEGAEKPVPDDENPAVILVEISVVDAVMHTVVRGGSENPVEPAELADELRMDPELVQKIDEPTVTNTTGGTPATAIGR